MEKLDLLLINAPARLGVYGHLSPLAACEPPVWAGLIARHCLDRGLRVAILDAEAEGLTVEQTAQCIIDARPLLAAFCVYGHQPSASTQGMPAASAVALLINGASMPSDAAHIPTLALGTHPSALPQRTLDEGAFDYVCKGEGPRTIVELLKNGPFSAPGLYFWHGARGGVSYANAAAPNLTDLDRELPTQAWELLDMTRYRAHLLHQWTGGPAGGYASVQTSLGCPFACSFCCIQAPFGARGIRYWSPANVAVQLERLVNHYGITNVRIPDEMFVLNRQHVHQICNYLIDMRLGDRLNMWAYARVDTVKDEALLTMMRRAGFTSLGIGIESGSRHVRDGVAKGKFDEDDIVQAIERVQRCGLAVGANYIFGLPDDTRESMQATLDLAEGLNTEWANFYCAMAYPGSPLHELAHARGWRLPEDPGGPGWIGYSQHAYDSLPLPTETLTAEEVLDFRDAAHLRYFARPAYQAMLLKKYGPRAVDDVTQMLALGQPKRRHRNPL